MMMAGSSLVGGMPPRTGRSALAFLLVVALEDLALAIGLFGGCGFVCGLSGCRVGGCGFAVEEDF